MKTVTWLGSSLSDLKDCPDPIRREIGFALHIAQQGLKPAAAVPLKGFGGASVLEIKADDDGNTYRAVYTVQFVDALYVLHCFKKKSHRGIATPQRDLQLIRARIRDAERHYRDTHGQGKG